jgi:SpoVK/Ycf46/Vps4 family AAA+-type ATPase
MQTKEQIDKILDLLKKDEQSPISKFLKLKPENDISYLNLWFTYFDYALLNQDFVYRFMDSIGWKAVDFELHYHLKRNIKQLLDKSIDQKLKDLEFKPCLEEYIEKTDQDNADNTKRLILGVLYTISKDKSSYVTLIELATQFNIPQSYILTLNKNHPVFRDKILDLDDSSLNSEKTFHQKDLLFNSTIYNIFAGLQVNEEDLAILRGSELLHIFDLSNEDYFNEPETDKPEKDPFDDEELDEKEDIDLDDITSLYDEEDDKPDIEESLEEEIDEKVDEKKLNPFKDNLDYLHEEYVWIKMLAELKDKELDDIRYNEKENERAIHLLNQKIQKQKSICEIRLNKSIEKGFTPRLEKITKRLKLSEFEKNVIKLLTVNKIFPHKERYSSFDSDVKDLIMFLLDEPMQQVQAKKYFLKNSKLIRTGLIQIEQSDPLNQDILNNEVIMDNRLIEYLIGENYDISDYIEGSFLYHSSIDINKVILPQELKDKVLTTINNFPAFLKAKNKLKFSEVVEYGNALAMLFVGKSGTGKTMLANAISNHLGKKILLFNFHNLSQVHSMLEEQQVFSVLFREARMNDAILFFDESEDILQNRINDLLIEIEKHEGIVIFATNAEFSIDEAMRRRINLILNIPDPGPGLRKDIWQIHLPEKMQLAKDVDLNQLARRYELNGGLIKNAVFSALFQAVNEDNQENPQVKMEHLEYGARDQLQNKLFMSNLERLKIPSNGLDNIVLPENEKDKLKEIINIEKSRKVLIGQWGFDDVFPNHNGVAVLFHGPSGTGKTITAEAIAYEMGKKLKIINYSQVVSMFVGGTEKALEALFEEVADSDSILLFDEADALFASRTGINHATDRYANVETDVLLSLIERYNTFTILTTNFMKNIDKAFYRRMNYIIEFKEPTKKERLELWKMLTPNKLPLHEDVNFEKLAKDYVFTGGDIKNVIIRAATNKAVSMERDVVIKQVDLETLSKEIQKAKNNGREKIGY